MNRLSKNQLEWLKNLLVVSAFLFVWNTYPDQKILNTMHARQSAIWYYKQIDLNTDTKSYCESKKDPHPLAYRWNNTCAPAVEKLKEIKAKYGDKATCVLNTISHGSRKDDTEIAKLVKECPGSESYASDIQEILTKS